MKQNKEKLNIIYINLLTKKRNVYIANIKTRTRKISEKKRNM